MKRSTLMIFLVLLCHTAFSQVKNPEYDKALADSLGGDDYGMKSYVLVILKTGPAKFDRKETQDSLFKGHINNIIRLVAVKKLIVSGPLGKNDKSYRGIFILNVKTIDDAKALLATDPAITAGLLDVELYKWYGSAALPEYLPYHEKIEKNKL
jgi:uncharacterized protein